MKKLLLPLAAGLMLAAGAISAPAQDLKQITIGSNPSGSLAHTIGTGIAKVLQAELGIRSAVEPHGGTSSYVPLLQSGELTLGIYNGVDLGLSAKGEAPYKDAADKVFPLVRLMRLNYAFVVRGDSGMKTVADLKGKPVIVGFKSNLALSKVNEMMLATAGLTIADVDGSEAGGLGQGLGAVIEGRSGASAIALGIARLREAHAGTPGGITVLELGDKATNELAESMVSGARIVTTKPSKNNVGVDAPIQVVGLELFLNAGPSVSEADGYKIAKAIHDNWAKIQEEVPPLRAWKAEDLGIDASPIPYHAGAAKFFAEMK